MHKVLKSQLTRCTAEDGAVDLQRLCDLVDRTYKEFDVQRSRSERATQMMMQEIEAADQQREAVLEKLRQEHLKLDAALEHMAHGLAMFDARSRLIVANSTYHRAVGRDGDAAETCFALDLAALGRGSSGPISRWMRFPA